MTDLCFRAFSRARWLAVATNRGIYDVDGNITSGFGVDEVGNMPVAGIPDTWWCVNLRLYGAVADADADTLYPGDVDTGFKFSKSKLAAFVRAQATPQTFNGWRAYEFGAAANRFQLLDPRDIATPYRVWAGGMSP